MLFLVFLTSTLGCEHKLRVRNLDAYEATVQLLRVESRPDVGVLAFEGGPDDRFFFNTLVDRLRNSPSVGEVRTDYIPVPTNRFKPDLVFSIQPTVEYRSSGWNFLVNWPGFLIFTPVWNGYIYHADVMTRIAIHDGSGNLLSKSEIAMAYSIRHADSDRTIWTSLTWLEVSALAFFGGIYNAFSFDRDVVGDFQPQVKDNYSTYVANEVQPKVRAAIDSLQLPEVGAQGQPPPRDSEEGNTP